MGENVSCTGNSQIQKLFEDILVGIQYVMEEIKPIKKQLEMNSEYDFIIKYGLEGFREKIIKSNKENLTFNPQTYIMQLIQKEPLLRFPHRKILEFLARQYDYEKKAFKEANFSTIVKECKIGKNKAGEYLKLLGEKNLIRRRDDGYRVWYRLKRF